MPAKSSGEKLAAATFAGIAGADFDVRTGFVWQPIPVVSCWLIASLALRSKSYQLSPWRSSFEAAFDDRNCRPLH